VADAPERQLPTIETTKGSGRKAAPFLVPHT
jgi:hypothetical protein